MAAQPTEHPIHLHILLVREHDGWVAQALQHDFAGQGATQSEALSALAHTIASHFFVAGRKGINDPLARVPAAPDVYWTRFERAARRATAVVDLEAPGLPDGLFGIKSVEPELLAAAH